MKQASNRNDVTLIIVFLILLIAVVLNSGCAKQSNTTSEVKIYYNLIYSLTGLYPNVDSTIGTLPPDHIGICVRGEVILSKDFWKTATDAEKEQLILHEIGHCFFGLKHTAKGIMQPVAISTSDYVKNRKYLLTEYVSLIKGEKQ